MIATNIARQLGPVVVKLFSTFGPPIALKSVGAGAATQAYVAVHPAAAKTNGEYWADCNVKGSSAHGRDEEMARRLWQATERIVAAI